MTGDVYELALFAGGGGGLLASELLGFRTVCAVEIEPSAREMLFARQRDGLLPEFPVWDDVRSFDGRPWRGLIDVISGGFPCQDISVAGRGAGLEGERSGLWREMLRIVREVRPGWVFVENTPLLVSRGLSVVLGDLAASGYDACWCVLGASDVGAPHRRERLWILALDTNADGLQRPEYDLQHAGTGELAGGGEDGLEAGRAMAGADAAHADMPGCAQQRRGGADAEEHATAECCGWWEVEPAVGRVVDGMAARVERLHALGNGQVPAVAAAAFKVLARRLISENF